MEEWKTYKLGDLAQIKGGKRLPKGVSLTTVANTHPYIRIRDLGSSRMLELNDTFEFVDDATQKTIARYIVNSGDVLLSIVGTIGLTGIVGKSLDKANLTENCVKIVGTTGISPKYLYYFLSSPTGQSEITKGIVGAVQPKLPIKNIQQISIPLPPLTIQERIVDILSTIDDKIELNNRINHNLEEQAQALYKSWFVDFEPFKDGKFVNSELGMIPDGWEVLSLGDVTEEIRSKVGMRQDVKVLSPITTGQLVLSEEYFTKQVFSESISKYLIVKPLDFAYNPARVNIGSIGKNIYDFDGCVSPVYVVFRCESGYDIFFDLYRRTEPFKDEVVSRSNGGVRQTLGYKDFALIKLVYPPKNVVVMFNEIYGHLLREMSHCTEENISLTKQRDLLLPKLMSGEISIS